MQDTQTLKKKIVALLDLLPADSLQILAEFAAFLRAKSNSYGDSASMVQAVEAEIKTAIEPQQKLVRISSPHLVNREQVADFELEVIEKATDDRL